VNRQTNQKHALSVQRAIFDQLLPVRVLVVKLASWPTPQIPKALRRL
jgi:hypothetical protein